MDQYDIPVYIYGLFQTGEDVPRYVGMTFDPHKRLKHHKNNRQHYRKYQWLKHNKVELVVLAQVWGWQWEEENKWIAKLTPRYNAHANPKAICEVCLKPSPFKSVCSTDCRDILTQVIEQDILASY